MVRESYRRCESIDFISASRASRTRVWMDSMTIPHRLCDIVTVPAGKSSLIENEAPVKFTSAAPGLGHFSLSLCLSLSLVKRVLQG